jgi:hypothetical protein
MQKTINRRHEPRRMRKHEAWILTDAGHRHCVVINISTDGATLSLREPLPLPKQFRLAFSLRSTPSKSCGLVWRRGTMAGVKFRS